MKLPVQCQGSQPLYKLLLGGAILFSFYTLFKSP